MGFHPAVAQPTVSLNNKSYSSQYSTNFYSGSSTAQTTWPRQDQNLIPTTTMKTRPTYVLNSLCICVHVLSTLPLPLLWIQSSHILSPTPFFNNFCCPHPLATPEGQMSHCSWLIWSLVVHQHLHDHLQGDMYSNQSSLIIDQDMVHKDFAGCGPYPTYVLQIISKHPTSTNPFPTVAPNKSTLPIPSFPDTPHHWSPHCHLPRSTKHQILQLAYIFPPPTLDTPSQVQLHQLHLPIAIGMVNDVMAIIDHHDPGSYGSHNAQANDVHFCGTFSSVDQDCMCGHAWRVKVVYLSFLPMYCF